MNFLHSGLTINFCIHLYFRHVNCITMYHRVDWMFEHVNIGSCYQIEIPSLKNTTFPGQGTLGEECKVIATTNNKRS